MRLRKRKDSKAILSRSCLLKSKITLTANHLVEVGCGKALMLVELAKKNPNLSLVGIEKESDILLKAARFIEAEGVRNISLVNLDLAKSRGLIKGKCSLVWLAFPDPWPKRRHQKRRLTELKNLKIIRKFLKKTGILRFKTDSYPLFLFTIEQLNLIKAKLIKVFKNPTEASLGDAAVLSNYEIKWLKEGRDIYFIEAKFLRFYQPSYWFFQPFSLNELTFS